MKTFIVNDKEYELGIHKESCPHCNGGPCECLCKECRRKYYNQYNNLNREKTNEKHKKRYWENREKELIRSKEKHQRNKEKEIEYRKKNREKRRSIKWTENSYERI
jgi:hypothetical protein